MSEQIARSRLSNLKRYEIDPANFRRSIFDTKSSVRNTLADRSIIPMVYVLCLVLIAIVPYLFLILPPLMAWHYLWASGQQFRLIYRMPIEYGHVDYSQPVPGQLGSPKKFMPAEGILQLGSCIETGEMLFLSNDDARRHAFMLGTTGAGKALLNSTPILTADRGWVRNDELQVGDRLFHPFFGTSKIIGIHPQATQSQLVRFHFLDGREAVSSFDHLWTVIVRPKDGIARPNLMAAGEEKIMTAADIAILKELQGDVLDIHIPMARAYESADMMPEDVITLERNGLGSYPQPLCMMSTASNRRRFLAEFLGLRSQKTLIKEHEQGIMVKCLDYAEGKQLRDIFWSLGGTGSLIERLDGSYCVVGNIPNLKEVWPAAPWETAEAFTYGLTLVGVEKVENEGPTQCIQIDRQDGLFLMEDFIVTHNTEVLLGMVSQALMWSSGFIFIDGKGTIEFHSRVWAITRRFGREDDLRIINFTDGGNDPDAPSGSITAQTNTMNPFAKGSSDQLINLIYSLMGDGQKGGSGDMWKGRAMTLVSSALRTLVEMRDNGDLMLDVQTIRQFLPLGTGPKKEQPKMEGRTPSKAKKIQTIAEIEERQWQEMRERGGGMIELYLRSLIGEFSVGSKLSLEAFFNSLPGFSFDKALNGEEQDPKASEQYNYLFMQLTQPLSQLADTFGHIFKTPLGEVDIFDIVLNRRILLVLLPALQKDKEELRNCGKIIVATIKLMMGSVSGSQIQGPTRELVDSNATNSASPFIVVLDEAGYYLVDGVDIILAQARSLGFATTVAGQDMSAMQQVSPQIAETASANARLTAFGATEDATKSWDFISRKVGKKHVAVSSGMTTQSGVINTKFVDRGDVQFVEVDRLSITAVQELPTSQFYFLFEGVLVLANTVFTEKQKDVDLNVNRFLKVRGPMDRVPGLDQSMEIKFVEAYEKIATGIAIPAELFKRAATTFGAKNGAFSRLEDALTMTVDHQKTFRAVGTPTDPKKSRSPDLHLHAALGALTILNAATLPDMETTEEEAMDPDNDRTTPSEMAGVMPALVSPDPEPTPRAIPVRPGSNKPVLPEDTERLPGGRYGTTMRDALVGGQMDQRHRSAVNVMRDVGPAAQPNPAAQKPMTVPIPQDRRNLLEAIETMEGKVTTPETARQTRETLSRVFPPEMPFSMPTVTENQLEEQTRKLALDLSAMDKKRPVKAE